MKKRKIIYLAGLVLLAIVTSVGLVYMYRPNLHEAIENKSVADLRACLRRGADVNKKNNNGQSPLHLAVTKEALFAYVSAMNLIEHGADVNAKDKKGQTPLHLAVTKRMGYDLVQSLIENGSGVNAKDEKDQNPLHIASKQRNMVAMKILVEKGADVNMKNGNGCTPLHIVALQDAEMQRLDSFRTINILQVCAVILIDAGADVNACDDEGRTPLRIAIDKGNNDLAELFSEHGSHK